MPEPALQEAFQESQRARSFVRLREEYQFLCRSMKNKDLSALILEVYNFRSKHPEHSHRLSEADLQEVLLGYEERAIRRSRRDLIEAGLLVAGDKDARGVVACRVNWTAVAQGIREWARWTAENRGKRWIYEEQFRPPKRKPRGVHVLSQDDRDKFASVRYQDKAALVAGTNLLRSGRETEANQPNLLKINVENAEQQLASCQPITEMILKETSQVRLQGRPIDEHTTEVISKTLLPLNESGRREGLAFMGSMLEDIYRQRRQWSVTWGLVVDRLQKYAAKWQPRGVDEPQPPAVPDAAPAMPTPLAPVAERLEYTPEQIASEPLNPPSMGDANKEAELDRERAARSPQHAEAVQQRWRLPVDIDVPADGDFLDRNWTEEWFLQWFLPCAYRWTPRKGPGVAFKLRVTKAA